MRKIGLEECGKAHGSGEWSTGDTNVLVPDDMIGCSPVYAFEEDNCTILVMDGLRDSFEGKVFSPLHWLVKNNHTKSVFVAFCGIVENEPELDKITMDWPVASFQLMYQHGPFDKLTKPLPGTIWHQFLYLFRDKGKTGVFEWLKGVEHE